MTQDESVELLGARWQAVLDVLLRHGGDPGADIEREGMIIHVRILSGPRPGCGDGEPERDWYTFKLDFSEYDEHAPRIYVCDPADRKRVGAGSGFYPNIEGNTVFHHGTFLCMPGDRRCYEQGNHAEWIRKAHFHPESVIGSLFDLLRHPGYRGRA